MKRVSAYIDEELFDGIAEISKRENRKITPMISILLQQAVKERNRKRGKKDGTEHNAGNVGESNSTR